MAAVGPERKGREMMEGLKGGEVNVVSYSPTWPEKYAAEVSLLQRAIGPLTEDIQHIGSTAIPGMPAKPIIDIAVAVSAMQAVESLIVPLKDIGYGYRGLMFGIEGHHFFRKGDPREYFLHVFAHRSDFWARRIAFRDYLITHADVAAQYRELKKRFAAQHADDRTSYTANKKSFVERMTDIAIKAQQGNALDRRLRAGK